MAWTGGNWRAGAHKLAQPAGGGVGRRQMLKAEVARVSILAALLGALPLTDAWAQSPDDDEVVIVTGRRADERLRDAPASVSVVSADEIERAGLVQLRDVAELTPNFSMLDNYRPGLERFQMRGLVTPQVGDPPVAFVIDGVTAPSPEFVTQSLFDIERVEILRGAQGALYGRSAVGGAVYIVSRQPSDRLEGNVSASLESGDTHRLSAVLSGPLSQAARFRIGGYAVEGDGVIENLFLGRGADFTRGHGFSGQMTFDLSERTTLDLRGTYARSRDGIGYYDAVGPSRASIEDFSIGTSQNVEGVNRRELYQLNAKLDHDWDFATLTLAGGYSRAWSEGIADADLTALPNDGVSFFPAVQQAVDRVEAWTFEGRLASPGGRGASRLAWALGAFYQDREGSNVFSVFDDASGGDVAVFQPDLNPGLLQFSIEDDNGSRAWAVSGEASYRVTDAFEVALAARYDSDLRRSVDPRDAVTTAAEARFEEFQPKLSLSYRLDADTLVYGGYSRGFRSGGFNQYSPLVPRSFNAEITDGYELGVRLSRFEDRLALNIALFSNDQSDAQITRFNSSTFTLENVAIDEVRAQGVEVELAVRPTSNLTFRFNGGYTNSEIRAFTVNPAVVGAPMPYVATYDMAFRVDHETPLAGDWRLLSQLAYRRSGPRSFNLDFPDLRSEAHDFVDARLALEGGAWTLALYGENLLDERQPEDLFGVFNGPVELARQPNRPRQVGIELRYDLGGQ